MGCELPAPSMTTVERPVCTSTRKIPFLPLSSRPPTRNELPSWDHVRDHNRSKLGRGATSRSCPVFTERTPITNFGDLRLETQARDSPSRDQSARKFVPTYCCTTGIDG